jgi:hypothetical protein
LQLIQFLVTIVQPQRGGLNANGSNKRRYPLMINDTPQSSKVRIQEIMQDLLVDIIFSRPFSLAIRLKFSTSK